MKRLGISLRLAHKGAREIDDLEPFVLGLGKHLGRNPVRPDDEKIPRVER